MEKNPRIIGIDGEEKSQVNGIEQIFNKIIEENFPKPHTQRYKNHRKTHRTPNRQDQKRKSPWHILVKTLNIHNKEGAVKSARGKTQVTFKRKSIRIKADFPVKPLKALSTVKKEGNSPPTYSLTLSARTKYQKILKYKFFFTIFFKLCIWEVGVCW